MSSSRLEKVKSSLFRSKTDSPSPRRASRPFSRILSPAKSKTDDLSQPNTPPPEQRSLSTEAPRESNSITRLPLNPRTSPASTYNTGFDSSLTPHRSDVPLPSRELHYDSKSSVTESVTDGRINDQIYSDTSEMDERYMKRQLMDMESSFMPEVPPPDNARSHSPSEARLRHPISSSGRYESDQVSPANSAFIEGESTRLSNVFATPAEQYHTPATRQTYRISEEKSEDLEAPLTQPTMTHSLSSPSAAAAQRSKLRSAAGFTSLSNATTLALTQPDPSSAAQPRASYEAQERPSSAPHEQLHFSDILDEQRISQEETNNAAYKDKVTSQSTERGRRSSGQRDPVNSKRLSYLENRQASQRSSASSYLSHEGGSDLTGASSGGLSPGSHSTVRPGHELSRLPSLGSVASTMSVNTTRSASHRVMRQASSNAAMAQDSTLSPVVEHRAQAMSPETPQIAIDSVQEPRDTVIARNVRDVEVPATVARNYREAQSFGSTTKSFASPNFSRTKGDLTLKEQNSRIDKLSKENFDLKLKIHYLYQALQDRSDEGVKDLISKNAQLSTDVIKVRKENQGLRRRVKQLERDMRAKEDGVSAVRTVSESEDVVSSRSWQQAQLEDEIAYLRDRMQAIEEDNERLRKGDVTREFEKRQMAGQVKSIAGGDQAMLIREELDQEKNKSERLEHEAYQLRIELSRLRSERSPVRIARLQSTEFEPSRQTRSQSKSVTSQEAVSLSGSTVVEQLRQENAELRRDLGAQTSMLTSRNRERERLQQEIEDLKLVQRRGDLLQPQILSVTADSLLDRSVSRNNLRPTSQASTQKTDQLSESEKDKYEIRQAALRDENAALRMRNQDLQGELDMLTGSAEHLGKLRRERDDALVLIEEERDFAADAIDRLEEQMEQKDKDINQLLAELRAKEDESQALEKEIHDISASLSRLADESEGSYTTVRSLQQDLSVANGELEAVQQNLQDTVAAKERLEVQAESSQSEIAFLREEQESDKIKISDLQSALTRAKTNLRDEKERLQEFEEMEAETKKARDEARRLKKALSMKEDEATTHRENLEEIGVSLRRATGATESGIPVLLKSVGRLRRDLESSRAELEQSKSFLEEKQQRLQDHIMLLESSEAERHRLNLLAEKERQARAQDRLDFQRISQSPTRNSRMTELEQAHAHDKQRLDELEREYSEALDERNQLCYDLWTQLSMLCGPEWLRNLSATTKQELPSLESIASNASSIKVPISLALDTITQTLSTFRTRIRSTEKDMYKDLEALSYDLDARTKRIDDLERNVSSRSMRSTDGSAEAATDIARLKDENHLLRRELKILKKSAFSLPGLPSPQLELDNAAQEAALIEHERQRINSGVSRAVSNPTDHRSRQPQSSLSGDGNSALQRHPSTDMHATIGATGSEHCDSTTGPKVNGNHAHLAPSEQRWLLRLKELERKLIAEREGRLLDRDSARKRLEERDNHIGGLKRRLDVERDRRAVDQSRQGAVASAQEQVPQHVEKLG